jgi:hypothetical protein
VIDASARVWAVQNQEASADRRPSAEVVSVLVMGVLVAERGARLQLDDRVCRVVLAMEKEQIAQRARMSCEAGPAITTPPPPTSFASAIARRAAVKRSSAV